MSVIYVILRVIHHGAYIVKFVSINNYIFSKNKQISIKWIFMSNNNMSNSNNLSRMWEDEYGVLFSMDKKTLIKAKPSLELRSYSIPDGTEIIGENAFNSCSSLKE